jgi:hypothetical protein
MIGASRPELPTQEHMNMVGDSAPSEIKRVVRYAFAPVHKAALGAAFGLTSGVLVAAATAVQIAVGAPDDLPLALLSQFFTGYTVTWQGAGIGFAWAALVGFVAGWFLAFLKNVVTALWMFSLRVNAALTQPFLDHI